MDQVERRSRGEVASLLAASDPEVLLAVADRCLGDGTAPEIVSGPEVGMVLLTVREPTQSLRFHLGEVLVTRTEVTHRGERGWSMFMGDERPASLAAAICDAEVAAGGPCSDAVLELCATTEATAAADRAAEWAELTPTIVDFKEIE